MTQSASMHLLYVSSTALGTGSEKQCGGGLGGGSEGGDSGTGEGGGGVGHGGDGDGEPGGWLGGGGSGGGGEAQGFALQLPSGLMTRKVFPVPKVSTGS